MSLRKKFAATKVSTLVKQDKQVESVTPKSNKRASYLEIEEGSNTFRIFPAHKPDKSFIYPKTVSWLPQEVEMKNKDGEVVKDKSGNPKTEIKNRPIFNSRIHGGTAKDIIEEYITFAEKIFRDECQDQETLEKKLKKLLDWKEGIKPRTTWIVYGKKVKYDKDGNIKSVEFGRIEFPTSVKDKMNELSDDGASGPITVDPFTDPDEGKAIQIKYDKEENPQNKYKVSLLWKQDWSLTDEELEDFDKQEPLYELFEKSYKKSDFEKALEGLRIYDEQCKFNLFDYSEWTDICEEIAAYYPDEEEGSEEHEEEKPAKTSTSKAAPKKVEKEEESDGLDDMDRDELIEFIKENDLEIRVMKKDTADTLRDAIRDEMNAAKEPAEEISEKAEEPKSDLPWDKEDAEKSKAAPKNNRMAAMKDKMKGSKK